MDARGSRRRGRRPGDARPLERPAPVISAGSVRPRRDLRGTEAIRSYRGRPAILFRPHRVRASPHVGFVRHRVMANFGQPTTPPFKACTGGFNLGGSRSSFGFYRRIAERGTNCVQACAVAHGYVAQLHGVSGSLDRKHVRVGGYVCTTRVTTTSDRISCSASRRRHVAFFGAP